MVKDHITGASLVVAILLLATVCLEIVHTYFRFWWPQAQIVVPLGTAALGSVLGSVYIFHIVTKKRARRFLREAGEGTVSPRPALSPTAIGPANRDEPKTSHKYCEMKRLWFALTMGLLMATLRGAKVINDAYLADHPLSLHDAAAKGAVGGAAVLIAMYFLYPLIQRWNHRLSERAHTP